MKLKDYFNKEYAVSLTEKIVTIYPKFNSNKFMKQVENKIHNQEYTEKMLVFVEIFDTVFPSYIETLEIFEKILGEELSSFAVMYDEGMWLAPIGKYVEIHSTDNESYYDDSVHFIEELTKRYTGEFAMRPFYPEEEVRNMFYKHLQLTTDEVSARLNKNYAADIKAYDMVQKEILKMSEFFVNGIVRQFPNFF